MTARRESDVASMRERILAAARERFFRDGFAKTTTEEIASDLGISKKTLFREFRTKRSLLRGVIESRMKEIEGNVRRILDDRTMDFVEKLKAFLTFMGRQLSRFGDTFLRDVHRNAPDIWERIEKFRRKQIETNVWKLFVEGTRMGAIRGDIPPQILVLMHANLVQSMINPEVLSQVPFSVTDVFETIHRVVLEGILTAKGRARFSRRDKKSSVRAQGGT